MRVVRVKLTEAVRLNDLEILAVAVALSLSVAVNKSLELSLIV